MNSDTFKPLISWFVKNQRPLPWRDNPSPYQVWVSEIMLQQTQAKAVIPYYNRFLNRFPSVRALADSPLEDVLKLWEGLGYYSRARNLHQGACYIRDHFKGELPEDPNLLKKIKGIGPYTLGAIMSFAFKKPYPAVDGNVLRVLTRFLALEDDISQQKTRGKIEYLLSGILTDTEGYILSEALIELGAMLCKRQAQCMSCPLKKECLAYRYQLTSSLPYKSKKIVYENITHQVWVLISQKKLLLRKNTKGLMKDLYEFPFQLKSPDSTALSKFQSISEKSTSISLPSFKQSFTKYRVTLEPSVSKVSKFKPSEGYKWIEKRELGKLPFSSGHKRLLEYLLLHEHF
jgi:A/G-specific adenine glycosylase